MCDGCAALMSSRVRSGVPDLGRPTAFHRLCLLPCEHRRYILPIRLYKLQPSPIQAIASLPPHNNQHPPHSIPFLWSLRHR
ncbi:Os08g0246950 [Oryza sativa Japonica Group]|uniref:Os08g0246950 protein n=1 Tax=Oryza sativa subsp. japonica TaxID=39947 RepID=A0A0P0XDL7_ORYSJ|nr:hypothetical protein EE612_043084 [Oryza sativa]BAT04537.1 Os08g0246950 [Oryza sativa Japonica Group]